MAEADKAWNLSQMNWIYWAGNLQFFRFGGSSCEMLEATQDPFAQKNAIPKENNVDIV